MHAGVKVTKPLIGYTGLGSTSSFCKSRLACDWCSLPASKMKLQTITSMVVALSWEIHNALH